MRATLLIFAALGLAAICLVLVIGMGLVHLSALDPVAHPQVAGGAGAATQPSAGADEGGAADAARPTAGPADSDDPDPGPTIASRSVFLSAADAQLTGPTIVLIDKNSQVVRTGSAAGAGAGERLVERIPERPADRGDFRGPNGWPPGGPPDGRRGRRRPPRSNPPFIARWNSEKDVAEWTFTSPGAGAYTVTFVYSAPPARGDGGGVPFVVSTDSAGGVAGGVAGDPLLVHLKPTARATTFEMIDVGTLNLPSGEVRLSVHPQGKQAGREPIRLRSVRLFPAK